MSVISLLLIKKNIKSGIFAIKLTILLFLIIAIFPIGQWLLFPLEYKYKNIKPLPDNIDGIIVLSGSENIDKSQKWNSVELGDGAERNLMFIKLLNKYNNTINIFTGGSGLLLDQKKSQADVAKQLYIDQGVDTKKIIFEKKSRNTYENAIFTKKIINPKKDSKWILITSAWHMPRAVGVFCKAGWNIIPVAVDHITLPNYEYHINIDFATHIKELNIAIKEWIGIVAYTLTNKINNATPSNCN